MYNNNFEPLKKIFSKKIISIDFRFDDLVVVVVVVMVRFVCLFNFSIDNLRKVIWKLEKLANIFVRKVKRFW